MVILGLAFFSFLLEVLVATRVLRTTLMHVTSYRSSQGDPSNDEKP
jgi:hypothetical protein